MLEVEIKRKLAGFQLDVNFTVGQETLAVLGPSGSGKTMTLQCIAGLVKPDKGRVTINNTVLFDSSSGINLSPHRRQVGFVFQNYALFPHLTVRQNIEYGIRPAAKYHKAAQVNHFLEIMNIQGLGKRYPRQLSSGQQQRVALARALAAEPEILLLDEPFSALDSVRKERLENELLELQKSFKGHILFVTHDLSQGFKLGSRLAVYDAGKIIQIDRRENVLSMPVNRTVARLTGIKNLMSGTIVEIGTADLSIQVPDLSGRLIILKKNGLEFSTGRSVTVGIRPEYIRFVQQPTESNTFLFRVQRIIEDVATVNCRCVPTQNYSSRNVIDVILPRAFSPAICPGQEYLFYLPPEQLAIIPD